MSILILHVLYIVAITAALVAGRRRMDWIGVGLVVLTVIGCNVAMEMDQPMVIVIVAGMITGCVGGVLRDILCNEVPLLFRRELYASVSIVTGALYVTGLHFDLPHDPLMYTAMAVGLAMRILALRYDWHMPRFVYTRELH